MPSQALMNSSTRVVSSRLLGGAHILGSIPIDVRRRELQLPNSKEGKLCGRIHFPHDFSQTANGDRAGIDMGLDAKNTNVQYVCGRQEGGSP